MSLAKVFEGKSATEIILIGIAFVFGLLLIGIAIGLLHAWALTVLWGWFVVPLGVVQITLPWAYGLIILLNLVTHKHTKIESENGKTAELKKSLGTTLMLPFFAVGMGWIVKTWFM